jgi:hypothetical protein
VSGAVDKREELLTTVDVARRMQLTKSAVLSLVARGKLVPDHRGKQGFLKGHRFKPETIEAFLRKGGV